MPIYTEKKIIMAMKSKQKQQPQFDKENNNIRITCMRFYYKNAKEEKLYYLP